MKNVNKKDNYQKMGELIEEIKRYHVNLKDTTTVVSSYIGQPRIQSGRPIWMCPFHNDTKPSFSVNQKDGKCGCFSCNTFFSNSMDFVQEYENVTLTESAIKVADILGIPHDFGDVQTSSEPKKPREKVVLPEKEKPRVIDPRKLNIAYEAFLYGCYEVNKSSNYELGLSKKHLEELTNVRFYSMKTIKELRFFTFPHKSKMKLVMHKALKYVEEKGFNPNAIFSYVPGFYFDRSIGNWMCMEFRNEGYAFPIPNENGLIIGIQIRTTSDNNNGPKYSWFTSAFAMNSVESGEAKVLGNSPSAPIGVIYPKSKKANTIVVTEGFHKAYTIANNMKESKVGITVQGVNNTKGIVPVLRVAAIEAGCGFLDIAFDGDMAVKETVLKPALKLGLNMSGLKFSDEMKEGILNILSQGNKTKETLPSAYKEIAHKVSKYLHESEDTKGLWFSKISFLLWENEEEKGIDDLVNMGKENCIKKISLANFWDLAFEYLSIADEERFALSQEINKKFREIDISRNRREEIFREVAQNIKYDNGDFKKKSA